MSEEQISMPTKYDPKSVEQGRYDWWVNGKFFEAKDDEIKTTIFHRDPTTKRYRKTSSWSCVGYNVARYYYTYETNARL